MNRQLNFALGLILTSLSGASVLAESSTATAGREQTTSVTAQDQSNKPADVALTQKIRKELMNRDLSASAKNITIVTIDGAVTLKGSVASEAEKNTIRDIAKGFASQVNNEITVNR